LMTFHPMVSEKTGETAQDIADIAAIETSEELSVDSDPLPRSFQQEHSSIHLRQANKRNVPPNSREAFYSSVNATVLVTVLQPNSIPRSSVRVPLELVHSNILTQFDSRRDILLSTPSSLNPSSLSRTLPNPPEQDMNSG
jgi:hypothetical protein